MAGDPINLNQVAKLQKDPVYKGMIKNIIRDSRVLDYLSFITIDSMDVVGMRWIKLPTQKFRRRPPYTPKFEAIFEDNLARIAADRFPDPISLCGTPAGWPRMLALPDAYEFVVRPEQTWLLSENGPNTVRVYTDGREHPAPEDRWATYTGNNVGHWEGDTLVFRSVGLKGVGSTILARSGIVMSDKLETTARMRLVAPDRLLVTLVLEDSEALTRPWPVAYTYTRLPAGSTVYDYACAENNNQHSRERQTGVPQPVQGRRNLLHFLHPAVVRAGCASRTNRRMPDPWKTAGSSAPSLKEDRLWPAQSSLRLAGMEMKWICS